MTILLHCNYIKIMQKVINWYKLIYTYKWHLHFPQHHHRKKYHNNPIPIKSQLKITAKAAHNNKSAIPESFGPTLLLDKSAWMAFTQKTIFRKAIWNQLITPYSTIFHSSNSIQSRAIHGLSGCWTWERTSFSEIAHHHRTTMSTDCGGGGIGKNSIPFLLRINLIISM